MKIPSDSSAPRPSNPLMMFVQQQQHAGSASASSSSSGLHPLASFSSFADTTHTKVFVGGLAWETNSDRLHRFYEHFCDILEAVVITGRSKGHGFVTFREPDSASKACKDHILLICPYQFPQTNMWSISVQILKEMRYLTSVIFTEALSFGGCYLYLKWPACSVQI